MGAYAFYIVLGLVFFGCLAMLIREGAWNNTVTLLNVLFAQLIATSYWEPLAAWMDEQMPTYTYLLDFIAIWAIFVVAYSILRAITDQLSKVRVKFKMPVEYVFGILMALAVAGEMVVFFTMTLHMAPLSRDVLGGALVTEAVDLANGNAPGHQWVDYVRDRTGPKGSLSVASTTLKDGTNTFDPERKLFRTYGQRRANLEASESLRVRR